MSKSRLPLAALGTAGLLFAACGGGSSSSEDGGGSESVMSLEEVSNGFGQLVPHTIRLLDAQKQPTQQIVSIKTHQDLVANLTLANPILPVPKFDPDPILPSGLPGNHFLVARFKQAIDIDSVLDPSPGSEANSGLTGAVSVVAIDPVSGTSLPVLGRAFLDGKTLGKELQGSPPQRPVERWVENDEFGRPTAVTPEGVGFPGTEGNFQGSSQLIGKNVFVFVPDADGNLSTHETFPEDFEIRLRFTTAVLARNGKSLQEPVLACTTVDDDTLSPEVIVTPPPIQDPLITPGGGDINVDPLTTIRIEFTEPVQPLTVGPLLDAGPPGLSSALKIQFGPEVARTDVAFHARPLSVFDLSIYELIPAFGFPGSGPEFESCGTFSRVDVTLNAGQVADLARNPDPNDETNLVPNVNLLGAATFFITGEGPGIVNAPVTPDALYIARAGAQPGISVLDLNGFGQSTGNPTFFQWTFQNEALLEPEQSNFPNNQNVSQQTGLRPPLAVGTCTLDGGSAGVFTLTRDSSLNDQVVRPPVVADVTDLMLGHALDATFNNASFPFGCQAGGGYICTLDGLKIVGPTQSGPNTLGPLAIGQFNSNLIPGQENLVSWAPHPNPPALSFPPLCLSPLLLGNEPTSVDMLLPVPPNPVKNNLLVPGDPFGNPISALGNIKPPSGLLTPEQNAYFLGPSQGPIQLDQCIPYQVRQQVGHFLYVIDRIRGEVTVLNSNRMTVLDRISVPDPTELAIGTNLDFLAITNQLADTVTFVDINPKSATFHQVVKTTVVGRGPRGIAWQPGNEDILVCNEIDNSMSIISAFSFEVRKTVSNQLNKPFDVVVFPRQVGVWSFQRGVYFAYVLNRNGRVAMFESGPNGVNGWGYDDIIGFAPFEFRKPKRIQADPINLDVACWIAHEGPLDPEDKSPGPENVGALSHLKVDSAVIGQIYLNINNFLNVGFRDMELGVSISVGEGVSGLSGIPVDIGFDNQRNLGGLTNLSNSYSAGAPIPANGKGLIRFPLFSNVPINCNEPQFLFAAVPNALNGSGVVDVMEIAAAGVPRRDTNAFEAGIQSVPVPNVTAVMDYWRQ